ncbi:MAG: homoserine dehydrogenase [Proteobacteria bacterium]|nr:homoserine dehydrogenase [Pseudomonadota bacterium]MDA1324535.1 homoserine dehydrogenase [Pseudomonadota bacterium]
MKIAIAGLGTVGSGLVRLLQENGAALELRCGCPIKISAVSARDRSKDRGIVLDETVTWFDDPVAMARDADADVIVELIGGADGVALALCEAAFAAGRHIITANKALIAHHGIKLSEAAEAKNLSLGFEAAVAGGIPIIKALREGLAGNVVSGLYGILNGTCNYILSTIRETGREFDDVLADAQKLGYAEADPSFDVDGIDTAHKLAILTSVAFGCRINFDDISVEGIRHVTALDIRFAEELGYRIKLLGITRRTKDGVEQRVHPCMVRLESPIAHVDGVSNAVVAEGNFVGSTVYQGAGAGAGPTASAVAADLVDIARESRRPVFSFPAGNLLSLPTVPMDQHVGSYYIRLMVVDLPGVFADVAATLRDEQVSMEAILQHTPAPGAPVPVVLTTHDVKEASLKRAVEQFAAFDTVVEPPCVIRIEPLAF